MLQHRSVEQFKSLLAASHTTTGSDFTCSCFTSGNGKHTFDRRSIRRLRIRQPLPNRTACQCHRRRTERLCVGNVNHRRQFFEEIVVIAQNRGLSNQDVDDVTSGDVAEKWQYIVSHAHTLKSLVIVHRVIQWLKTKFCAQRLGFVTSEREQWSSIGTHSGQTCGARATQQVDEDGFGLIVCSVTRQYIVGQYRVAGITRPRFDVGITVHRHGA
jgi:hypothetical protein